MYSLIELSTNASIVLIFLSPKKLSNNVKLKSILPIQHRNVMSIILFSKRNNRSNLVTN